MTQLPPSSSRPMLQQSVRVRPATYSVAVYIVGAVLLLEVAMIISVFWLRHMVVPVNFQVPKPHRTALTAAKPPPVAPPQPTTPSNPSEMPNLAATPGNKVLLTLPAPTDTRTRISNLLDEAALLRRQNDLKGAATALIQAEDLDSRNPEVLQGLAETYYMLNDALRSKIYWQRLADLGPAVGRAYSLARDHVLLLNSSPDADPLSGPSILGRLVYIEGVDKTPVTTVSDAPQFQVRTVLMRKDPKTDHFDQRKLQPYVIFYQQMADGTLAPDLREHKGAFEDTFLFWNKKLKEAFTVTYNMPVPGSPGPNQAPLGQYYGFVIGIYYDKTLQDARSEPADLITRLPLPDAIE